MNPEARFRIRRIATPVMWAIGVTALLSGAFLATATFATNEYTPIHRMNIAVAVVAITAFGTVATMEDTTLKRAIAAASALLCVVILVEASLRLTAII